MTGVGNFAVGDSGIVEAGSEVRMERRSLVAQSCTQDK